MAACGGLGGAVHGVDAHGHRRWLRLLAVAALRRGQGDVSKASGGCSVLADVIALCKGQLAHTHGWGGAAMAGGLLPSPA